MEKMENGKEKEMVHNASVEKEIEEENSFWYRLMDLPPIIKLPILLSAPALILMNQSALVFVLLLIPLLVATFKNIIRDVLVSLPLLYYSDLGIVFFGLRFIKPIRRYYDLGIFSFIFSLVALFFVFTGQPSLVYALFRFDWSDVDKDWGAVYFVSSVIYLIVFVIAKMALVHLKLSSATVQKEQEAEETKQSSTSQSSTSEEKVEIDPNKASFKYNNIVWIEDWIRKDRTDRTDS